MAACSKHSLEGELVAHGNLAGDIREIPTRLQAFIQIIYYQKHKKRVSQQVIYYLHGKSLYWYNCCEVLIYTIMLDDNESQAMSKMSAFRQSIWNWYH